MPNINPGGGPPLPITGNWDTQVSKYRALVVESLPGIYNGNTPAKFKGLTFPQIYDDIINSKPHGVVNPYVAFQATALLWTTAKLAGDIIAATVGGAVAVNASEQGISRGIAQFTSPLQWLSSPQFWVRAGEVLIGLVLIGVGLAKLAESNGAINKIVSATPAGRLAKGLVK